MWIISSSGWLFKKKADKNVMIALNSTKVEILRYLPVGLSVTLCQKSCNHLLQETSHIEIANQAEYSAVKDDRVSFFWPYQGFSHEF